MKNLTSIVLLVSFTICGAYGQTFTITGKVVDEQNQVIPYANILLLEAVDSTFVQGSSADEEGFFKLTGVEANLYLLQASYVGSGSEPRALDITKDVSLGALIIPMESNSNSNTLSYISIWILPLGGFGTENQKALHTPR